MPTVTVKLYSVFYKLILRHRLQSLLHSSTDTCDPFGVTSRPDETVAAANPTFSSSSDGVATKDIHIDPLTSLSIRIFLPSSSLPPPKGSTKPPAHPSTGSSRNVRSSVSVPESDGVEDLRTARQNGFHRRNSYGGSGSVENGSNVGGLARRSSFGSAMEVAEGTYKGYLPTVESLRRIGNSQSSRKLPVILQFHGGGFVAGSADSVANDFFCRRIARLCDAIVIAVGYRLAPESRFPAAFEDGLKVLNWLGKQANLMECSKSMSSGKKTGGGGGDGGGGGETRRSEMHRHIIDTFGSSMVEPWLAAHADPSRCVLLGVSCGANIANFVAQKAVEAGKLLDPVKVVAQVLMYPFFIGCAPTQSEIKLANSYFYDKSLCTLAWKLFLPEEEFSLDHPAANPLIHRQGPPLKCMPPTLTVVAEHDWMRDRAIAYSEELRKVNVDAPVLEYKDAVHEFATLDIMLKTPQAQACAEDIAIWVKKYISTRGHEFSY